MKDKWAGMLLLGKPDARELVDQHGQLLARCCLGKQDLDAMW